MRGVREEREVREERAARLTRAHRLAARVLVAAVRRRPGTLRVGIKVMMRVRVRVGLRLRVVDGRQGMESG